MWLSLEWDVEWIPDDLCFKNLSALTSRGNIYFLTSELEATEGPTEINEWCVKSVESTRAERSGEPPRWKDDSDEARVVKSRTHNEWGAAAAMRPTETEQQPEWVESLSSNIYSFLNYISLTRCSYLILLF